MGKKLTALFGICFLLLFSFTNQAEAADQGSIKIYAHGLLYQLDFARGDRRKISRPKPAY